MPPPTFTITSYNIHKGMSPLGRKVMVDPIAKALKQLNSDILCLQEVQGQNLKRVLKFNDFPKQPQHEWFGEYLQMLPNYGKNCQYPHGHHGNAILSRFALYPKHNVNISVNRFERRGLLHCEIVLPNLRPISVLNAHLNLLERDRTKQYQAINDYIKHNIDPHAPLILAGDFNDWQQLSMDKLTKNLQLQEVIQQKFGKLLPTFPARLPLLSLDRIYIKNLTVKQAWLHTGKPFDKLSDHLPISAKLAFI
nr:endonuclease/exonuclease/phosphatase family protein [Moraxella macacae]